VLYAWFGWGYGFAPRGGTDQDGGINFDANTAYGSWFTYTARKPWQIVDVTGSSFKSGAAGNHEFKFGFGYRRNPNASTTRWSGSEVVAHVNPTGDNFALAYRARVVNYTGQSINAYVGDTYSRGRLTVNGGVRWDKQTAKNEPSTAPANTAFPDLLPTLAYDGSGPSMNWNNVSPRVGATIALDQNRKTVARASYANYAGQMNPFEVTVTFTGGATLMQPPASGAAPCAAAHRDCERRSHDSSPRCGQGPRIDRHSVGNRVARCGRRFQQTRRAYHPPHGDRRH